jgi:peroxiredoxin
MKRIPTLSLAAALIAFGAAGAFAQTPEIRPITLGQAMPGIELPAFQGGTVNPAGLKGKNVLVLFPRGYASQTAWCTICNYQLAELIEMEKAEKIREKHNLEVLVVLPYDAETVTKWVGDFPAQLAKIRDWKNPPDEAALDEAGRRRMERFRQMFPLNMLWDADAPVPMPFPVLIDAERKLSGGLGLFAEEWGGSKVAQNIPTIFLLDTEGKLVFKYFSQNTFDRPSWDYVLKMLGCLKE